VLIVRQSFRDLGMLFGKFVCHYDLSWLTM